MHWSRDWSCTDHVTDHALIMWMIMHWSRGYHALLTWLIMQWSRRDPNKINIYGSNDPPGARVLLLALWLVCLRDGSECRKARVKRIANLTRVQIPLQLAGRVSSNGPPQHQMSSQAIVNAEWLFISQRTGLHCTRTHSPRMLTVPPT